jgi:hypothetical protein
VYQTCAAAAAAAAALQSLTHQDYYGFNLLMGDAATQH